MNCWLSKNTGPKAYSNLMFMSDQHLQNPPRNFQIHELLKFYYIPPNI